MLGAPELDDELTGYQTNELVGEISAIGGEISTLLRIDNRRLTSSPNTGNFSLSLTIC